MQPSPNLAIVCLVVLCSTVSPIFICPGLGFYPDPLSCTAFYRCVSLQMSYHYICPQGTRYDPSVQNCNHDHLAPTCKVGQSGFQEDIFLQTQGDTLPELSALQDDKLPGIQEDILNQIQEDLFPSLQEDIYPELQEDIYPGIQEDISPELQGDISLDLQEDISIGNVNNGTISSLGQTTEHAQITEDQSLSNTNKPQQTAGDTEITNPQKPGKNFLVSPTSIYPCKQPGYYSEQSSCTQFYVCREVSPGVLSADRIFRCPDRYVFDVTTQLCQRKQKVNCDIPYLFYAFRTSFIVQLQQHQLDQFFSQSLLIPNARKIPLSHPFSYPWVLFPSHVY